MTDDERFELGRVGVVRSMKMLRTLSRAAASTMKLGQSCRLIHGFGATITPSIGGWPAIMRILS